MAKQSDVKVFHLVFRHGIWIYSHTLYLLRLVYPLSGDKVKTNNTIILTLYYCNIIKISSVTDSLLMCSFDHSEPCGTKIFVFFCVLFSLLGDSFPGPFLTVQDAPGPSSTKNPIYPALNKMRILHYAHVSKWFLQHSFLRGYQ